MTAQDPAFSDSSNDALSLPATISGDGGDESVTHFLTPGQQVRREIPQVFGGYRILREIGRGGMGIVFEALEVSLNRRVAVKVLTTASQLDDLQRKRFRHESLAVAQLSHSNIVPIYKDGEEDGVSFFAMRYITGRNLSQVIQSIRSRLSQDVDAAAATPAPGRYDTAPQRSGNAVPGSRPSDASSDARISLSSDDFRRDRSRRSSTTTQKVAEVVARIGVEIASALQHAHDMGVIHRDIKPSNLLLDEDGRIWVTDFGLAHLQHEPSITRTGELLGTLRYMSPEQAAGRPAFVDHRTDVYSLGVTLYELLTLRRLIPGTTTQQILREVSYGQRPSIRRLDSNVPADLATILDKATARDPHDRYDTAREFADDLSRFLRGEPILARSPGL